MKSSFHQDSKFKVDFSETKQIFEYFGKFLFQNEWKHTKRVLESAESDSGPRNHSEIFAKTQKVQGFHLFVLDLEMKVFKKGSYRSFPLFGP